MAITAHVYQIFIATEPEQVWAAITRSEWTRQYFHGTSFVLGPTAGQGYRTVTAGGGDAVEGTVEEMEAPTADRPGRFVVTWHVLYDADLAAEPPSRVEWTVERAGERLTRVRVVHGDLARSPLTWASVKDGWVWVLDGLKTLLETGAPLARPALGESRDVGEPDAAGVEAAWHRRQGMEANNATWELLEAGVGADDPERLLRGAYAAAYHWERAAGAGPQNEARAEYLLSRAWLAAGQPGPALAAADRVLAVCAAAQLGDFDLAYGHEARARALQALGRAEEAATAAAAALAVPVAGAEDRALVESDLADLAELTGLVGQPAGRPVQPA